jgi:hypothetical protein
MIFNLPRFFTSGDSWQYLWRKGNVEHIGSYAVGGTQFEDCIRVDIDNSADENDYRSSVGYFILARDVGIVELEFERLSGTTVRYEHMEHGEQTYGGSEFAEIEISIDPEGETVCEDGMRRWTAAVNERGGVGITLAKLEKQYYHDEMAFPDVFAYIPADNEWLPEYLGPYEGFSTGGGFPCGPGVNENVNSVEYRLQGTDDKGHQIVALQRFDLF